MNEWLAASFWKSSQFEQWLFDCQELISSRLKDISSWSTNPSSSTVITEDDYLKVLIFYSNIIQHIGEQYKVRQQVIATGIIYLKRFYAKYPLKSIDPWLLCPTCLFLAAKVEEFSTLSHQRVCNAAVTTYKKYLHLINGPSEYPYSITHILECEFYLLEIMDCCLIVYHYEIALACLLLAATYRDKVSLLEQYMIDADPPNDGKQIKDILSKVPKPKVNSNDQQTRSMFFVCHYS